MRFDPRARSGALVGGLAMFFALDIAFLASLGGFAFAPDALGQSLIEILPGFIVVPLIGLLQFWAKRLLVAGVIVFFLVCGAAAGIVAVDPKRRDRTVLIVGALPWVATVVLGQLFARGVVDLSSVLLTSAIGALTFFVALQLLAGVAAYQPAHAKEVRSPSRRRVLYGAAAVAVVVALGSLGGGAAVRAVAKRAEGIPFVARRLRPRATPPAALETFQTIPALTPQVTSNADHYTVDTTLIKPAVDVTKWSLDIGGSVESPFSLSYDELLDLEAVEQLKTLECISNEVGGELISTALWTGVPLRDLLARAKPKAETYDVKLTSVDGYTDSVRLEKALEPDTIVAYLMNGVTIPGIAFAGAREIAKVEVSTDGGRSFTTAELEPALGPLTWVRWKLDWTPPGTGKFTLVSRATDRTGALETEVRREPFPNGATGWDKVDVVVTRG